MNYKSIISRFLGMTLAVVCLVCTSTRADASLITYICDDVQCTGGNDTIITDQGAGDNFPGSSTIGQVNSGVVNFGGFTIVTNVGQSKPLIGSAAIPQIDLTFSAVTSDSATHTVYLYVSDTGFTGSGLGMLTLGGTQSPAGSGNSITARVWGGNSNTNLDLTNLIAVAGPNSTTPFALSANGSVSPVVNPYGLTIGLEITRAAAGSTTGDLNLSVATPEPGSLAFLGTGLIGLAAFARRFAKK